MQLGSPIPQVSIHAPARGATRRRTMEAVQDLPFQSTPPARGRPSVKRGDGKELVSIHAPARGATNVSSPLERIRVSIPPPRGGDNHPRANHRHSWFQSTPPRGGRRYYEPSKSQSNKFQSTPPRGGRPGSRDNMYDDQVSIHAPARGATPLEDPENAPSICFNPRPRAGGDCLLSTA